MYAILWLALLVVFLIVEAATVSLVSLWFAAGALAAVVVTALQGPLWLQILVFVVVSAVLLILLRPLARKYVNAKVVATNADSVIGTTGLVTAPIDNVAGTGQVKLGGMYWTARSSSGSPIPMGAMVTVDRIEGVKVLVSPAPVGASV